MYYKTIKYKSIYYDDDILTETPSIHLIFFFEFFIIKYLLRYNLSYAYFSPIH